MQEHLTQKENRKTRLSVQAPSLSDNDTVMVAAVVRHILIEIREAVSEEDKIIVITELIFN
jgi:hypothetical protein